MPIHAWSDQTAQDAQQHQNNLTKPQGSLGRLEEVACWLAARQHKVIPDILTPHIVIFAADHGVTEEGISAYPSVVTGEMVKNFSHGGAAINVLAKQVDATLSVVDVGVASDLTSLTNISHQKVRTGTNNLLHTSAMTKEECNQAIQVGKNEAAKAIDSGCNLLIAGEMGIGNTTASACLVGLLTQHSAAEVVGCGTGIDSKTHLHKVEIVHQTITRVKNSNISEGAYLQEVGGLEIAAICGFYLEAAARGIPVVLDGFITTAAALAAQQIEPEISQWLLSSHLSQETGHLVALNKLGLTPLLNLKLRLGEGTGAALTIPLLQSAIALHREMATFESAGVSNKESS